MRQHVCPAAPALAVIFLEKHPNLQTLDPFAIGENIKEVLQCGLKAE